MTEMNDAPSEMIQRLEEAMGEAWQSPGGMCVDASKCESCPDHWHVMICPAVRELMGGAQDGQQVYARFVVHLHKLQRAFDKRPRMFFDSALGESVPHIVLVGKIAGYKCDVSIMCCPPSNMNPLERVYVEGPKKGTVETIDEEEEGEGE